DFVCRSNTFPLPAEDAPRVREREFSRNTSPPPVFAVTVLASVRILPGDTLPIEPVPDCKLTVPAVTIFPVGLTMLPDPSADRFTVPPGALMPPKLGMAMVPLVPAADRKSKVWPGPALPNTLAVAEERPSKKTLPAVLAADTILEFVPMRLRAEPMSPP